MRKDIKKSSYYVWFLGAQEAKGFRGSEFIVPVIADLVEREREVEPYKVTLQTSYKGMKIVQNVPLSETTGKHKSAKSEVVKHFIPHQAITSVYQEDDIVACILLLFNPVTKCPLHVHVYRCDSVETAAVFSSQLQTLVNRPENQKKLSEMEARLKSKGRARDSESSGGSLSSGVSSQEKIASLYDSLAAELKEKLGTGPILLPPRDYDTVHRQKGDLSNIDSRRCLNASVVGQLARGRQSPGSSGIGSDHAPSPDRGFLHQQSSSDEEWALAQFKSGGQKNWSRSEVSLPRARRQQNESIDSKISPSGISSVGSSTSLNGPVCKKNSYQSEENSMRGIKEKTEGTPVPSQRWRRSAEERQRTPSPIQRSTRSLANSLTPRERFQDAKEKFLSLERTEQERMMQIRVERRAQNASKSMEHTQGPVVPVFRPHLIRSLSQTKTNEESEESLRPSYSAHDEEIKHMEEIKFNQAQMMAHGSNKKGNHKEAYEPKKSAYQSDKGSTEKLPEDCLSRECNRLSYPSDVVYSVKDHHQSRRDREKNIEAEKLRYEYQHKNSPHISMSSTFPEDLTEELGARPKRQSKLYQEQEKSIPLDRYRSPPRLESGYKHNMRRMYSSDSPQNVDECHDMKNFNHVENQHYQRRQIEQSEKKRRSLYETVEEERKRSSNELAKEFMKRSFHDQRSNSHGGFKDEPDHFVLNDRESGRVQDEITPRYRHSYVEPINHSHEHIQRASAAMSPPRVGIAAIHPY